MNSTIRCEQQTHFDSNLEWRIFETEHLETIAAISECSRFERSVIENLKKEFFVDD